jgi:hypothetical protein
MRQFSVPLLFIVLVACVVGCESSLRVTSIQLGRSLNADDTVEVFLDRQSVGIRSFRVDNQR